MIDSHVHFWDPGMLQYRWLRRGPALNRTWPASGLRTGVQRAVDQEVVFVEANSGPDQGLHEVCLVERYSCNSCIAAIVACVDLYTAGVPETLDWLADHARVRGIRNNIQGNPPGFCLRPAFVAGVQEAGRRGLRFDVAGSA